MKTRVITAGLFASVMFLIGYLTSLSPLFMLLALWALAYMSALEIRNALSQKQIYLSPLAVIVPSLVLPLGFWGHATGRTEMSSLGFRLAFLLGLVLTAVLFFSPLLRKGLTAYQEAWAQASSALYLFIPAWACLRTLLYFQRGLFYVALALTTPWVCDSAAYFIGSAWGKHKCFPLLSPKKSWEGCLATLPAAWLYFLLLLLLVPEPSQGLFSRLAAISVLALFLAPACVFGDLFESCFKRYCGIKDSGRLLPGHGGVVDRFDSFSWVVPVQLLVLQVLEAGRILPW